MATVLSQGLVEGYRKYPTDTHGKLRFAYFYYKNETGGTLADGTEIDLVDLPTGRIRVLPKLCSYRTTLMGASRTLDIGHREYYKDDTQVAVAEDDDAWVANKDVSAAVNDVAFDGGAAALTDLMYSKGGIRVYATIDGGTIPADGIIEGYLVYVYE